MLNMKGWVIYLINLTTDVKFTIVPDLHQTQTFYTLCLIKTVLEYFQQKSWIVSTKFLSLYMLYLSKCTFT